MPLRVANGAPSIVIRRSAYEGSGLIRAAIDERLGLTAEEFRVEGDLVAVGPVYDAEALSALLEDFEGLGLAYYDDFFELSGNWPDWLSMLVASDSDAGRSKPSQPQR